MPKFHTIKDGDILYDVRRVKLSHVEASATEWFRVHVIKVSLTGAIASWNGNKPRLYGRRALERLRRTVPKKIAPNGVVRP